MIIFLFLSIGLNQIVEKKLLRCSFGETTNHLERQSEAQVRFSLALAYSLEGDSQAAIKEYQNSLIFEADSDYVLSKLAEEYFKNKNFTLSLDACQKILAKHPNDLKMRMLEAAIYASSNQESKALQLYNKIIERNPTYLEAILLKAQLQLDQNLQKNAIQDLIKSFKKNLGSAAICLILGKAYQYDKQYQLAINQFKKAYKLNPQLLSAQISLAEIYEQIEKKPKKSLQVYEDLYDMTQDLHIAHRLAQIYLKNQDFSNAIQWLKILHQSLPNDFEIAMKLGLTYIANNKYVLAAQTFEEISIKDPDNDRVHFYLATVYIELQSTQKAIAEIKKIPPDSPISNEATLLLANLFRLNQQATEASLVVQKALEQFPNDANFALMEITILESAQRHPEAAQKMQHALQKYPHNENLLYYAAIFFEKNNDISKTIFYLERLIELNPQHAEALNFLGYTLVLNHQRIHDAKTFIHKALKISPTNPYIQDSWGWYLYTTKQFKQAILTLEKANSLLPNEPTICEHLGDAYLQNKLVYKAFEYYEKALLYTTDESTKAKIQGKLDNIQPPNVKKLKAKNP
jgi:tetratricopeptide (TPR) repeat protein